MLSLFKKKKGNPETIRHRSPNFLPSAFEIKAVKISGWLNQKTAACSTRQKKTGLVIFCMFFGGICLYLLTSSMLSSSEQKPKPVKAQTLSTHDSLKSREMMSSRMFENLKQLKIIYQHKNK